MVDGKRKLGRAKFNKTKIRNKKMEGTNDMIILFFVKTGRTERPSP